MKIFIKKLGCPKNDVDGDYIAGKLVEKGHQIVSDHSGAETVIVNTCGFILPAKEESIDEILFYEKLKEEGEIERIYVTGCLSQRYSEELSKDIPGVDGFFGLGQIDILVECLDNKITDRQILSVVNSADLSFIASGKRFSGGSLPYEYIKIADGCDRYCAYCTIPFIRGRYRSRSVDDIISEARTLANLGKKEIILVSQEGTGYGRDFDGGPDIIQLLKQIERISKIEWIRLMYLHPESLSDELIDFMSQSKKTLGYFDIPLQHINDKILEKMNRKIHRNQIIDKLSRIKENSSENVIRTTFITGFPGETDKEFDELHNFIEDYKFDRLGVFKYSPEEGTIAFEMENRVPDDLAEERQDLLMSLQQEIAFERNIGLIDSIQKVIIDEIKADNIAVARSKGDCPEIDQTVFIRDCGHKAGDIIDVRIIMADGYDLIAVAGDDKK